MRHAFLIPLGVAAILPALARPSHADAQPNETVAHWDFMDNCVTATNWTYDSESLTKQTLPNEWTKRDAPDALEAGASIIRQDYWYFYNHPDSAPFCADVSPYSYNMRDSRMAFIQGSNYPSTDSAADNTAGDGWSSGAASANDLFMQFGSVLQNDSQTQVVDGYNWMQIVGSAAYPPGEYAPGNPGGVPAIAPLSLACLYNCAPPPTPTPTPAPSGGGCTLDCAGKVL